MPIPDEAPKINPWPWIAGDAALFGIAAWIASQASAPLTGPALFTVAACVALGAVLACVPFLLNYTRRQDMALAERQNEIAALAQSTAASAEQLNVAAAGLHTIADLATKALKHADQLPTRLQEKVNEFKAQLNEVAVTENEALAQEVNTLRTSETERLETALGAVRKTAAELAALETSVRKQIETLGQTLQRFTATLDQSAAKFSSQQASAEKALASAQTASVQAVEQAVARALAGLEAHLRKISAASSSSSVSTVSASPATETAPPPRVSSPAVSEPRPAPAVIATTVTDEPVSRSATESPRPSFASAHRAEPAAAATAGAPAAKERHTSPVVVVAASSADTDSSANPAETVAVAHAPRKRPPRKAPGVDDEPSLGLDLASTSPNDEYAQIAPEDARPATAVSADGCTRLLVTAYIGIGNKLFIRGDGPGLSRERGVPLQFVSIGKWRWETVDAVSPVALRILKNDELECASLGEITLEPGRQQEVTATF